MVATSIKLFLAGTHTVTLKCIGAGNFLALYQVLNVLFYVCVSHPTTSAEYVEVLAKNCD